jgi:hypothetical protein
MTLVMIRIFHEGTEGFRRFYDHVQQAQKGGISAGSGHGNGSSSAAIFSLKMNQRPSPEAYN